MSNSLELAQHRLLAPTGLGLDELDRAFARLLGPGVDSGDLYFQHSRRESWTVEDGIVKDGAHAIEQGVGVRAISGEKTGFAYSDDIRAEALLDSAAAARAISRDGNAHTPGQRIAVAGRRLYAPHDPVEGMPAEQKMAALRTLDALVRAADPRVRQVVVSLSGAVDTVLVARSDGVLAADVRPLVRCNVQVIVEQAGRRESGYAGCRRPLFLRGTVRRRQAGGDRARGAAAGAARTLEAVDAPAGTMPVVLGPGWPGVLLHEAVGHGLEGDFNRKGTSVYAGRIGQRVAAPGVTIVDDGTIRRPARLAQRGRRGHRHAVHHADRGRHPASATCRTPSTRA